MADIPLSKTYLHDLKELNLANEEKRITDEEFSKRVDELREREAQSNPDLAHLLLLQKLEEAEKEVENEVKKKSQQTKQDLDAKNRAEQTEQTRQNMMQQLEKEKEERKLRDKLIQRENERCNYRSEMYDYINRLENNAQKWQSRYTWLQIILLVFSAGTAAMASIDGVPRWIVSVAGLIATITGGLLTTFKIQDRIYASRKAVTEVKLECQRYDYRIEEYEDTKTDEEAFIKFSRSLSAIQGQEMLQEVELWNPKKDGKSARDNEAQRSLAPQAKSKEKPDEQPSAEAPQNEEQKQAIIDSSKEQLQSEKST